MTASFHILFIIYTYPSVHYYIRLVIEKELLNKQKMK